jgi:hypothetical protein
MLLVLLTRETKRNCGFRTTAQLSNFGRLSVILLYWINTIVQQQVEYVNWEGHTNWLFSLSVSKIINDELEEEEEAIGTSITRKYDCQVTRCYFSTQNCRTSLSLSFLLDLFHENVQESSK